MEKQRLNAAWLDLTTGEFFIASEQKPENLFAAFEGVDPREILVPEQLSQQWGLPHSHESFDDLYNHLKDNRAVTTVPDYHFDSTSGAQTVMETLGVLNLEGFGIDRDHPALGAAGALVYYATETLCAKPRTANCANMLDKTLLLDPATLRNLEIFKSAANTRQGSLLAAMDGTVTPPAHACWSAGSVHPSSTWAKSNAARTACRSSSIRPASPPSCKPCCAASAISNVSSADCKTACATRANSAVCVTRSMRCPRSP